MAARMAACQRAGSGARTLSGGAIKGRFRLMGSSFGPICCDKGDGGCSDAPKVMA